jgi:tRNA threonylcarbamoyladenosine biosynthesis protein TsaE
MMTMQTMSEQETRELGHRLSQLFTGGEVIALIGELGGGKTAFVRGIATGLAVHETVHSPSFTIVNEYHGRLPLYHLDFYRVQIESEIWAFGWQDYLNSTGVIAIEWADRFPNILPEERLEIRFTTDEENEKERIITFIPIGEKYLALIREFQMTKDNVKFQNPNAK